MTQFSAEQILPVVLAATCGLMAMIAVVFLMVWLATRRVRGLGWLCGWTCFAMGLGLQALGARFPAHETLADYAATGMAIVAGFAGVWPAFSFRNIDRMPVWAVALLSSAAVGALFTVSRTQHLEQFVAPEIVFVATTAIMAVVLFPVARTGRRAGLLTVSAIALLLTLVLSRTLVYAVILALHGQQLSALYWCIEAIGGGALAVGMAMGEIVAVLDEVRVDLEGANAALSDAMADLEVAAKLDPLTGLYNRYAFYTLISELKARDALGGAIAIVDLNNLKRINDSLGHHAGDRALLNVAQRLREAVRQSDYVFRWGGDEFVLLLFGVSLETARDRLAHMQPPAPLYVSAGAVPLAVSWGVAKLSEDVESNLRDADGELYAQKRLFKHAAGRLSTT